MSGFAWLPIEDSERLEEEQDWIDAYGPITGSGLDEALNAAMLDVHEGDDER